MRKADWGERDVVPLSPAVRKANRRNKVVPRACPWGSTLREKWYPLILSEIDTPEHFRTAALDAYHHLE